MIYVLYNQDKSSIDYGTVIAYESERKFEQEFLEAYDVTYCYWLDKPYSDKEVLLTSDMVLNTNSDYYDTAQEVLADMGVQVVEADNGISFEDYFDLIDRKELSKGKVYQDLIRI